MKDNKPINPLAIAFGSLLFYTIALPILDSVSTHIQNKFNLRNVKLQVEAQKVQESMQEQPPVHAIGFAVANEEEDYDNE